MSVAIDRSFWRALRVSVVVGGAVACASPARAVDKHWNVGASTWDSNVAWSPNGKPISSDAAYIEEAGALVLYQNPSTPQGLLIRLRVDFGGSAPTFSHSTDNLTTEFTEVGYNANGVYSHAGGRHTVGQINGLVIGAHPPSFGTYNLASGATLTARRGAVIGASGTGVFNQTGGTFAVGPLADSGTLYLGTQPSGEGTLNLSGGTLTADAFLVGAGGGGEVNHSGGSVVVGGDLRVGESGSSQGKYNLSAGATLTTLRSVVGQGNSGAFFQTGGTHHANVELVVGSLDSGVYFLTGGSLTTASASVGALAPGMFLQLGGQHTCAGTLSVGTVFGLAGRDGYSVAEGTLTAGAVDVKKSGALFQEGGAVDAGALSLASTASATFKGGATRLTALSLSPGAVVDVADQEVLIDYTGATPAAAIRAWLAQGYAGGAWTGAGIRSSTAAAAAGGAVGVGYAEAADVLAFDGAPTAPWMGHAADPTSLLVRYTLYGDTNLDGLVDFNDLVALAQNYNSGGATGEWSDGDFTYDGLVDFGDLVKLAQNYNAALPGSPVPGAPVDFQQAMAAAFATVPEPGAAGLAGAVIAGLTMRTRRRGTRCG